MPKRDGRAGGGRARKRGRATGADDASAVASAATSASAPTTAPDVRVTSGRKVCACVDGVLKVLLEQGVVVVGAHGAAVGKAVTVAEIVKRRVRGVYQNTQIGLHDGKGSAGGRTVREPCLTITLSTTPLDATAPGYQPPLTDCEWQIAHDEEACRAELRARQAGESSATGAEDCDAADDDDVASITQTAVARSDDPMDVIGSADGEGGRHS